MSYILDALRRAEAERERGSVPSLHTQQYGGLPGDDEDDGPRGWSLSTLALLLGAAAAASAVGWHYFGNDALPAKTAAAAQPVQPALPVAAAPSMPDAAASTPAPAALVAPTTTAAAVAPRAAQASTSDSRAAAAASAAATKAARAAAKRDAPVTAAAAGERAAASVPGERIYAVSELPDDVRRELPKLSFGGASYSNDAASRMVIFNGQVFHEGDSVVPGLVLKRVNRKSAIFSIRSYRYELVF